MVTYIATGYVFFGLFILFVGMRTGAVQEANENLYRDNPDCSRGVINFAVVLATLCVIFAWPLFLTRRD